MPQACVPPHNHLTHCISADDLDISFARSGGAGGQNVNKVNTKADIRMNVDMAAWLPEDMKEALRAAVCLPSFPCSVPLPQMQSRHVCVATDPLNALRSAQEGNRFNKEGEIVVTSTRTRSQAYAAAC